MKILNLVNLDLQILEEDNIEKWTLIKFFGSLENQSILSLDQGRLNGDQFKGKLFYMSKHQQIGRPLNCSINFNLLCKNYDFNIDGYKNLEGTITSQDCSFEVFSNFEFEKVYGN